MQRRGLLVLTLIMILVGCQDDQEERIVVSEVLSVSSIDPTIGKPLTERISLQDTNRFESESASHSELLDDEGEGLHMESDNLVWTEETLENFQRVRKEEQKGRKIELGDTVREPLRKPSQIPPTVVPTKTPKEIRKPTRTVLTSPQSDHQNVLLVADGSSDTYLLIAETFGGYPIENPDCAHQDFGPHITQAWDDELNKYVFIFHIHVDYDNDRCLIFDRQRTEIKTYSESPSFLKGFLGENVTFSWRFKLDEGFQPSPSWTHIHQIKPVGGPVGHPMIAITLREVLFDELQITHYDYVGKREVLDSIRLREVKGLWIEGYEKISYGFNGTYSLKLTEVDSGKIILFYENSDVELWREGVEFVRPKWGIYRNLQGSYQLRDEKISFDQFCLAKDEHDCES